LTLSDTFVKVGSKVYTLLIYIAVQNFVQQYARIAEKSTKVTRDYFLCLLCICMILWR